MKCFCLQPWQLCCTVLQFNLDLEFIGCNTNSVKEKAILKIPQNSEKQICL